MVRGSGLRVNGSCFFFDFPRPLLAKRGSTSPCIPSPQAREKLRISRIPHSQSSGIAREACALKGERCVFPSRSPRGEKDGETPSRSPRGEKDGETPSRSPRGEKDDGVRNG